MRRCTRFLPLVLTVTILAPAVLSAAPALAVTFLPPTNYTTGLGPRKVVAGNFTNGDTNLDLVVVNNGASSFSFFPGNGNGTFQAAVTTALAVPPTAVAAAKLKPSGYLDLAITATDGKVYLLSGNGAGAFPTSVSYDVGTSPTAITTADLDFRNGPDLAVTNSGSGNVSVLINDGSGAFTPLPSPISTGAAPSGITAGMFSAGSEIDLAVVNHDANTMSILYNNGFGGFPSKSDVAAGTGPAAVVNADFNNDDLADLAIANSGAGTVSVVIGTGSGSFAPKVDYLVGTVGANPAALTVGDFNRDGRPDLAVVNQADNQVRILIGYGDGTFQVADTITVETAPSDVLAGDWNGDGQTDLAVVNSGANSVSIFLNASPPVAGVAVAPAAVDFGIMKLSGMFIADEVVLTIANNGTAEATVNSITLSGPESSSYSLPYNSINSCQRPPFTLNPAANCTLKVRFNPVLPGTKNASLEFASTDPLLPLIVVPLAGKAVSPSDALTVAFAGSGGGSVAFSTGGSCSGTCSVNLVTLVEYALTPSAAAGCTFSGWSGCDWLVNGTVCHVLFEDPRTVTPTFTADLQPVRIDGASPSYYPTLTAAYAAVADGATLQAHFVTFTEGLLLDRPVTVILQGGYDYTYGSVSGVTTLHGTLTIRDGALIADKLIIS